MERIHTYPLKHTQLPRDPEIIKEVFSEHGFPDVADELNGEYAKVGYCVQYRESTRDFVRRIDWCSSLRRSASRVSPRWRAGTRR